MVLTVVFYVFIAFTAIQIAYYLVFTSVFFSKKGTKKQATFPVSVIIFAKNNAENLTNFLPSILSQNYPTFEVVLIDNNSSDNTEEVINSFALTNSNIKLVSVENNEAFWGSKKYALTLGIKAAKYEYLLFIEPNCKPISEFWISEMSQEFSIEKSIVLGYSTIKNEKNISNFLIRFYHFISALQYLNFAKLGIPFMADGKNLAYTKSEFYRAKGYINHMKQELGEDDLFIQDAANETNTAFCIQKNSFTESVFLQTFSNWFLNQRKKVFLKKRYQPKHRFLIGLFSVSKFLFYVLGIILCFFYPYEIMLSFFGTYFLIQFIVIGIASKRMEEKNLIFFLPFLDISFLLIQISIFIANLTSKPTHWK
ncbi:glycosyltransferase [Polaribacter gangjinensis]|uniref:Glycosyl transferase family 2 n=1 Tax=Polaribacter gangjinensis TaxID=574710 RepID=A0A2S7W8Q7_9FLAO|nr:glycosyltransferase [Polaribacter gangjinensis]PQJ74024.1 glycosyl transferase family 2 [Polaribacter gangjinensis]